MADTVKHIDQGGPAFPELGNVGYNSDWQSESGMSLRDWFAGQALAGLGQWTPGYQFGLTDPEGIKARSEWAYAHADAMIDARKAGA